MAHHATTATGHSNILQIKRARQKRESTVDALPSVVCLLDGQGCILRANHAVERWRLGHTTDIEGQSLHTLLHPGCSAPTCPLACFWRQALKAVTHHQDAVWDEADAVIRRHLRVEVHPLGAPGWCTGPPGVGFAVALVRDLTESKQAEQALQANEKRYRHLVDNSQGLICTHALDGTVLSANPASAELLGYAPEEWVGKNVRDFLVPAMQPLFDAYLKQIRHQPTVSGIMHVVTKAGEERVWMYRNTRYEEAGQPPYVLGHAQDITELMQTQRALRESEERYRSLLEGSLQGVLVHRDFTPVFVNQAYATMHGYNSPDEILKLRTQLSLIAPHERDRLLRYNRRRLRHAAAPDHYEYQGLRKDGAVIWLDNKVTLVQWQGEPATQCTVFNITQRKQAEAQLAATHAQLAKHHENLLTIVNQLRLGVVILDAGGHVIFLSQACQRLFGTMPTQVQGQPWQKVIPFASSEAASSITLLSPLPLSQPMKVTARLEVDHSTHHWVEIDAQPDPRDAQQTLLFFYDVSEVYDLRRMLGDLGQYQGLVGQSRPMLDVYRQIQSLAQVNIPVLIEGETGTGKELVAQALHHTSPRRDGPFVAMNCAGLQESLLASQLFGHKRGAFTGAVTDQQGLFEAANGGTLLLDEIGDMPLSIQASMLRVLQQREIVRLGETRPRAIDVRILAATHHNLQQQVDAGSFRADLFYRIRVARLSLPPLRQRQDDIPLLVQTFLAEGREQMGKAVDGVSQEAMQYLLAYPWPGNVRELCGAIEAAVVHCQGAVIQQHDLPPELLPARSLMRLADSMPQDEKQRLLAALEQTGWRRRPAARLLGMSKSTFYRHLARHGISVDSLPPSPE
jgi:PAS domain S-box-containing protein